MTLDGNTDTSYGFMRMERCGVAYAEEPASYITQDGSVTQFGKQGTCSVVGKFSARISGGIHQHAQVSRITQEAGLDRFFFGGAEIALVPSEPGERPTDAYGQVRPEDDADMGAPVDAIHMVTECLVDFSDLQNRYESRVKTLHASRRAELLVVMTRLSLSKTPLSTRLSFGSLPLEWAARMLLPTLSQEVLLRFMSGGTTGANADKVRPAFLIG